MSLGWYSWNWALDCGLVVINPCVAKMPNPAVQSIGKTSWISKYVYLMLGSPWQLSSIVSLYQYCKHMLHFFHRHIGFDSTPSPPPPHLLEREWKQKWDTEGSKVLCSGCGILLHLSLLLAQGSVFLPTFLWGKVFNPLILLSFCLGHVPRIPGWSFYNSELLGH